MTESYNPKTEAVKAGVYVDHTGLRTEKFAYQHSLSKFLISKGNYGYPDFPPVGSTGGAFQCWGSETSIGSVGVGTIRGSGPYSGHTYTGSVYGPTLARPPVPTSILDGTSFGATAYNRMKPTKPTFPGANAIYEMREVPEMLSQKLVSSGLHNVSNYWLALQFGWKPLLSDILNMVQFQQNAQKKLGWLLKHNGKPVRRSVELVNDVTGSVTAINNNFYSTQPGFVTYFYNNPGTVVTSTSRTERVWASARFRFWLPEGPRDVAFKRTMMRRLFGAYPSPQFVWNALPWSWLADWFSNAGDVLSNLDVGVADRLAADYCYVMRSIENRTTYDYNFNFFDTNFGKVSAAMKSYTSQFTKTRIEGDPFGLFGANQDLSPMQASILGALGASRI